jgi:alkylation response protein AidB-like acyl-CoA dehydrogenase
MDLSYTPEESAFRDEVRAFLAEKLPLDLSEKVRLNRELTKAEMEGWHATLQSRHWLAAGWPEEHGGPGWTPVERHIFDEECALAHAPRVVPFGLNMLGPVLLRFGTDAQRARWLPRILSGEDWWCQGYSEPGAGSDLASLKTRAVRDGDHYVVNGQKTWTTLGQFANMIFCLVRTDPDAKPQEGISFLLVDMDDPGVEVRPIVLLDGSAEVNEVWLTDVRVPAENLVGEENRGWTIAKYLLGHERAGIAGVGSSRAGLEAVRRIARSEEQGGRPLLENPHFAARLARVEIDLEALAISNLRAVTQDAKGESPGLMANMLKVKGTIIRQEINDLARRAAGPYALPLPSEAALGDNDPLPEHAGVVTAEYLNNRKLSIYGGSNEVQRQIVAKAAMSGALGGRP